MSNLGRFVILRRCRVLDFDVKEKRFEEDIEDYFITNGGYIKGEPTAFDRKIALDKATFLNFIQTSQPKSWER
mgnify:CR=1 FL=1